MAKSDNETPDEARNAVLDLKALAASVTGPGKVLEPIDGGSWTHTAGAVGASLSARRAQVVQSCMVPLTQEAAALSIWADPGEAPLRAAEEKLDAALKRSGWRGWDKHAHAHRLLRRARKRPSKARRVLALWLVLLILQVGAAQGVDGAACFIQRRDEDETPSERAEAAHARLGAQPAGRPAAGPPPRAPTLIPQLLRRGHLLELRRTAAGLAAQAPRAHAMDPQAMFAASPLAVNGSADQRAKAQLQRQVAELKARMHEGDEGVGLDRISTAAR